MSKTGNATGSNNNYFYTFWKDGGSVNMSLPSQPPLSGEYAGNFAVTWQSGTYNFVGGKGWQLGSHNYQVLATEVFNPASAGASNCTVW